MPRRINSILKTASGKKCWHITVGGVTFPNFTLALGRKIKRESPLQNPKQSKQFRNYEGELSFFVRCSWRLEHGQSMIASSDDEEADGSKGLRKILGKVLVGVKVEPPAWDLELTFSDGWRLKIFCDRSDSEPEFRKNWHAGIQNKKIYAGPGTKLEIVEPNLIS
jgi:hypothetical protein